MLDPALEGQGRYLLVEKLGEGVFATTYLATDRLTGQRCVVKVLSLRQADSLKTHELFEREARVLANLDHPRIPRFVDSFHIDTQSDTRLYLVQEHVPGQNLARLVSAGRRFSEAEARRIALAVAEVLEYLQAFSPPMIHRDIKPSNVLLTDEGEVHLVDFGAVRDKFLQDPLLAPGGPTVVGTFGYMPLEQFEGQACPASDIFSLGVSLIHILSGKEPWELPKQDLRIAFEQHVNVSRRFAALLARMVAPDWRKRPASAGALIEELRALESRPRVKWPRTRALLAIAGGIALAAVGLVALVARAPRGAERHLEASPPAVAFVPPPVVAPEQIQPWRPDTRPTIDDLGDPLPPGAFLRLGTARLRHGGPVRVVRFSPDGRQIASGGDDGLVSIWEVRTGAERGRLPHDRAVVDLAFSPDGQRIGSVVEYTNHVLLWDAATGREIARLRPPLAEAPQSWPRGCVSFSADGRFLAAREHAGIDVWNVSDLAPVRRAAVSSTVAYLALTGPDPRLVTVTQDGNARIENALDGREPVEVKLTTGHTAPIRLSDDGTLLVSGAHGAIEVWELTTKKRRLKIDGARATAFAITSDKTVLASGSEDGALVLWELTSGRRRGVLDGHRGHVQAIDFSADGRLLASGGQDGTVRVWDVVEGSVSVSLGGHEGAVTALAFAPNQHALVTGDVGGTLRFWSHAGRETKAIPLGKEPRQLSFVPKGRVVIVQDDRFRVLDPASGWQSLDTPFPYPINSASVAPNGLSLATGSSRLLDVWDTSTGRRTSLAGSAQERALGLSGDGRLLFSEAPGGTLVVRDRQRGQELTRTKPGSSYVQGSASLVPGSGLLLLGSSVWALVPGDKPQLSYKTVIGSGSGCVISPRMSHAACVERETSAFSVYRIAREGPEVRSTRLARPEAHRGPVRALAFSPDSRMLATAGTDSTVLLWDIERLAAPEAVVSRRPGGGPPRVHMAFEGDISGPGVPIVRFAAADGSVRFIPGRHGQALRLTRPLDFPELKHTTLGSAYTFETWFRLDAAPQPGAYTGVVASELVSLDVRDQREAYVFMHFYQQGGHAQAKLSDRTGPVEPGRWYHVAVTHDRGAKATIVYADGCPVATREDAQWFADRVGAMRLGAYIEPGRPAVAVALDELKIYDYARTAADVRAAAERRGGCPQASAPPTAQPTLEPLPPLPEDVTSLISLEQRPAFTVYRFTGALAQVQPLDLDIGLGAVWVGTSRGLLRWDLRSERLTLFGAQTEIPGERVHRVAVGGDRVVTSLSSPYTPGSVIGRGQHSFDPRARTWHALGHRSVWDIAVEGDTIWFGRSDGLEAHDTKTAESRLLTPKDCGLLHADVHAVRPDGRRLWLAMLGDHDKETDDFFGGGVSVWDRAQDRWNSYTKKDGLARAYSCDLAVDEREVWVAHWEEEIGLSVLDRGSGRWSAVRRSSNGLDIGGVVLASDGPTLWIGQQAGLAALDKATREAICYREQDGLPGHIVSGIRVDRDSVWATAYRYGKGGIESAGLVRIPRPWRFPRAHPHQGRPSAVR